MRILLVKGQSQYDALRLFLDEARAAFEGLGHQVVMLDLQRDASGARFAEQVVAAGPFDLAFSYVLLGDYRSPDGRTLGELVGAPHIIQHVDHPLSHLEKLKRTSPQAAVLLVDQSHVEVVRSVMGPDRFAHVGFNPHAAIGEAAPLPDDAATYGAERPDRFLFSGTWYRPSPETLPWRAMPANVQALFHEAAEVCLSRDWIAPHRALAKVLASRGVGPGHDIHKTLTPFSGLVHEWVRATRRFQFIEAAARTRAPLTVYGAGYDADAARYPGFDFRGPADFSAILARMRRTRVVFNVNVNFGEGSHERPLAAMLAGAVCASEPSAFYDRCFPDEMAWFRWSSLDEDLQRIRDLAEDPQALLDIARRAQARAAADHTWTSRARTVLEVARRLSGEPATSSEEP